MKLGFLSAILPDVSFDKVLAFAAVNRFACVEVACWPVGKAERRFAGVTHLDVAKFTAARPTTCMHDAGAWRDHLGPRLLSNPLDPDTAAAKRCVGTETGRRAAFARIEDREHVCRTRLDEGGR
jgi:hypothetical protein